MNDCEHNWIFDYQELYSGVSPSTVRDVFHCSKCLKRKYIEIDKQFNKKL